MSDIIGDINHSIIEGMNKITYTKRCEFCGAEFTTPNHSRRYCSKRCVQATYKMRLKEKRKSEAVKILERSHGLMPEVCYFNVTQTASILGLSRMSVYRMIYDGRLKATRLSSRATRISRDDIESTMIAQRMFSPVDFYTFNDILKMTGRSRSWTFNFLRRNGISHTCHSGIRHYDKLHFDKAWAQTSLTLPEKGWITLEQVCNEFHMKRSFAILQLTVHQITRRTSGNTTYYSRREIINITGSSGGSYFCSVQEAMNDYGMSYDQVRHYLKQGKIQSQVINGDLKFERDLFEEAAHIKDRTPKAAKR